MFFWVRAPRFLSYLMEFTDSHSEVVKVHSLGENWSSWIVILDWLGSFLKPCSFRKLIFLILCFQSVFSGVTERAITFFHWVNFRPWRLVCTEEMLLKSHLYICVLYIYTVTSWKNQSGFNWVVLPWQSMSVWWLRMITGTDAFESVCWRTGTSLAVLTESESSIGPRRNMEFLLCHRHKTSCRSLTKINETKADDCCWWFSIDAYTWSHQPHWYLTPGLVHLYTERDGSVKEFDGGLLLHLWTPWCSCCWPSAISSSSLPPEPSRCLGEPQQRPARCRLPPAGAATSRRSCYTRPPSWWLQQHNSRCDSEWNNNEAPSKKSYWQ